jgi:hypothetical protein
MTILRRAILASAMTLALAAPALAQGGGGGELDPTRYMYIGPTGSMSYMTATPKGTAMLMKYAKPVSAGTIFFRNNGTLYMVQDRKMANGVMLFQAMRRDSDSNS